MSNAFLTNQNGELNNLQTSTDQTLARMVTSANEGSYKTVTLTINIPMKELITCTYVFSISESGVDPTIRTFSYLEPDNVRMVISKQIIATPPPSDVYGVEYYSDHTIVSFRTTTTDFDSQDALSTWFYCVYR